jgi:hypothetical protein
MLRTPGAVMPSSSAVLAPRIPAYTSPRSTVVATAESRSVCDERVEASLGTTRRAPTVARIRSQGLNASWIRRRSSGVSAPAKGEDWRSLAASSLISVMKAATSLQGRLRIARHSASQRGAASFHRACHRSRFRCAMSIGARSRSIFAAIRACIARLRISSIRCEL